MRAKGSKRQAALERAGSDFLQDLAAPAVVARFGSARPRGRVAFSPHRASARRSVACQNATPETPSACAATSRRPARDACRARNGSTTCVTARLVGARH
jgi:hypothetical protein